MPRPKEGHLVHKEDIKLWLDNPDASVYFKSNYSTDWIEITEGDIWWFADYEYKVILPQYLEAWEAWLDDELEECFGGTWIRWPRSNLPPSFTCGPEFYRRKPAPKFSRVSLRPHDSRTAGILASIDADSTVEVLTHSNDVSNIAIKIHKS